MHNEQRHAETTEQQSSTAEKLHVTPQLQQCNVGCCPIRPPMRVKRERKKGWKKPDNTVYVGRGSKWGNPHRVGISLAREPEESKYDYRRMTSEDAVEAYKKTIDFWLQENPKRFNISELKGKNLMCWCPLNQKCHADILLQIANG